MSLKERFGRIVHNIGRSREALEAEDETRSAANRGTTLIRNAQPRTRVRVSGVLQAVTYRPAAQTPVLVGRLYDGTGSIELIWLGRHKIAGIKPGVHLSAEGTVVPGKARPAIYNPIYEIHR